MHIYGPSYVHGPQAVNAPHSSPSQRSAANAPSHGVSDEVQISSQGNILARLGELPEIRQEKVQALRAAIASGSYETDAKLNVAVDRLLDEIG